MGLLVDLLESLDARVGVDLRRRDRRVAEQLLHGAQVGAGVEEVRGEGVAQRVDAEAGVLVDLLEEARDGLLHGAHADALAGAREEHGVAIGARPERAQ